MTPSPGASLTDLLESITAGGVTYKLTLQQILTLFGSSFLPITVNTLTTTDNSFNAISNITVAQNSVKKITANIVGKNAGGINAAWASLDITLSRTSGNISIISDPVFNKGYSTTEDINYSIDDGLDVFIINVKGVSAQNYKWSCSYSTQLVTD